MYVNNIQINGSWYACRAKLPGVGRNISIGVMCLIDPPNLGLPHLCKVCLEGL